MTQQHAGSTFYVRDGLGRVRGPYPLAFVLRLAASAEGAAFYVSRDGLKFARLLDEPSIAAALGPRSSENTPPVGVAPVAAPASSARDELRGLLDRWRKLSPEQLLGVAEGADNVAIDTAMRRLLARYGLEKPENEPDEAIRGLKRALWARATEAHRALRHRVAPLVAFAALARGG